MASQDFDLYQNLRDKFRNWMANKGSSHKWAKYLMWAPDLFHLLCKLSIDKEVPAIEKAKLAATIAYFVAPIDLIPEAIVGPVGYVDDIALAAYVLNSIINNTSEDIVKRHWADDEDVLEIIRQILLVANEMVGSGLWKKLKRLV